MVELSTLGSTIRVASDMYVTPMDFGATGDGVADDTTAVQAAIESGSPVFLDRMYLVTRVYLPSGTLGFTMQGNGYETGLKGTDANSECIFQTCTPGVSGESRRAKIQHFRIWGSGKRGLGICQLTNSVLDSLFVYGPTEEAIVMEQSFGNVLRMIETGSGAKIDMLVGQCVLDTIIDLFYTNNAAAQNHILIDGTQKKLSNQNSAGHGINTFNMPTLQGARGYGIKVAFTSSLKLTNVYTEAMKSALFVKDCDLLTVVGSAFSSTGGDHAIWLDSMHGGKTYNCSFHGCSSNDPIVVGEVASLALLGCHGTGFDPENLLRTSRMSIGGSTAINITSVGEAKSAGNKIVLRCTDDASLWAPITVASDGSVSGGTTFTPALVAHEPHQPIIYYGGTSTPAWTSGVAITPISPTALGGTTPYAFDAWSGHIDYDGALPTGITVNATTGQISGTPTETGTFQFKVRVTDASGYTDTTRWVTPTVS